MGVKQFSFTCLLLLLFFFFFHVLTFETRTKFNYLKHWIQLVSWIKMVSLKKSFLRTAFLICYDSFIKECNSTHNLLNRSILGYHKLLQAPLRHPRRRLINTGERTHWSPIRSVIIWVITKSQESDLLIMSMITDRHQTTWSPLTN